MANLKISQLPEYSGNTSGSYLVMNNSGETTTYKVKKENYIFPYNGDATITGSLLTSGSLTVTQNINIKNGGGIFMSGFEGSLDSGSSTYMTAHLLVDRNFTSQSFRIGSEGPSPVEIGTDIFNIYGRKSLVTINSPTYISSSLTVSGSATVTGSLGVFEPVNGKILRMVGGQISISDSAFENIAVLELGNLAFLNILSGSYGSVIFGNDTLTLEANKIKLTSTTQITGSLTVSGSATITGSVNITNVMKLSQQSPLPTGTVGSLAVSGSNLFYHNGSSWSQIN